MMSKKQQTEERFTLPAVQVLGDAPEDDRPPVRVATAEYPAGPSVRLPVSTTEKRGSFTEDITEVDAVKQTKDENPERWSIPTVDSDAAPTATINDEDQPRATRSPGNRARMTTVERGDA